MKINTKWEINDLRLRQVRRYAGDASVVRRSLKVGVRGLTRRIQYKLLAGKHVATGKLIRSISAKSVTPISPMDIASVMVHTAGVDYGLTLEKGREKGAVPKSDWDAILKWVSIKINPPNPQIVAYRIIRSISKKGTSPHPYMEPSFERQWDDIVNDFIKSYRWRLGL